MGEDVPKDGHILPRIAFRHALGSLAVVAVTLIAVLPLVVELVVVEARLDADFDS